VLDTRKFLSSLYNRMLILLKRPIGHSLVLHSVLLLSLVVNFSFIQRKEPLEVMSTPISVSIADAPKADKESGAKSKKVFTPKNSLMPQKNSASKGGATPQKYNQKKFDNLLAGLKKNAQKKQKTAEANKKFNQLFEKKLLKDLEKNNKKKQEDAEQSSSAEEITQEMTLSTLEEDEIRNQIIPNWIIPAGVKDAENLIVEVLVEIAPDGTIIRTKILNPSNEINFRIAAQSAERAVLLSSPLKISSKRLKKLKEFVFHFNPKDVL